MPTFILVIWSKEKLKLICLAIKKLLHCDQFTLKSQLGSDCFLLLSSVLKQKRGSLLLLGCELPTLQLAEESAKFLFN